MRRESKRKQPVLSISSWAVSTRPFAAKPNSITASSGALVLLPEPDHSTQLEVAAVLGVSDSLVSDYRRRIEQELRALSFTEVEEAKQFELALRNHVKTLIAEMDHKEVPV